VVSCRGGGGAECPGIVARVAPPLPVVSVQVRFAAASVTDASRLRAAATHSCSQSALLASRCAAALVSFLPPDGGDSAAIARPAERRLVMMAIGIGGVWAPIGVAAAIGRGLSALMIHVDVARRGKAGDILAFKWFFDSEGEALSDRFETKGSVAGTVRAFGRRDLYVLVWVASCFAGIPLIGLVLSIALSTVYFCLAIAHLVVMRRR
jgi:hypothetical protein